MYLQGPGRAHPCVGELARSVNFHKTFLNLQITETAGDRAAFLSSGSAHCELALTAIGANASTPQDDTVGLFHLAIDVPEKRAFAEAHRKLSAGGVRSAQTSDRKPVFNFEVRLS